MVVFAALLLMENGWSKLGLADPFRVKAGVGYVDSEHGHAHPLYTDWNGDKVPDLLVGQFEGGKARIYWNKGSAKEPKFEDFGWFQAGGADGKVPFG